MHKRMRSTLTMRTLHVQRRNGISILLQYGSSARCAMLMGGAILQHVILLNDIHVHQTAFFRSTHYQHVDA